MSDRRFAFALLRSLALAVGLGLPAIAVGQSVQSRTAQQAADDRANDLRDRFLHAWTHYDRLNAKLDSAVRAQTATPPFDTIVAGAIVVRLRGEPVPPAVRASVERGTALAWATARKTIGASADLFAGHPINLTRQPRGTWDRGPRTIIAFPGKYARWQSLGPSPTADQIAEQLLDQFGSIAGASMPSAVKRWTSAAWIPLRPSDGDAWRGASVELATSRSSYGRRCYEGAMADCAVVLDLVADSTADRLHSWYRPEDIPAMVSEYHGRDSVEQDLFRRCATGQNATVCDSAALKRSIVTPLSISARLNVLAFALERGGPDGYERLMKATGSTASVLATTAGVPFDQLLTEWRANVRQATPERTMPGPLEGVTLIAWTALFATLAARRRP